MNQLSLLPVKPRNNFKIIYEMKKGIHPENYRLVAFKDMSNGTTTITKSTAATKEIPRISFFLYYTNIALQSSFHRFSLVDPFNSITNNNLIFFPFITKRYFIYTRKAIIYAQRTPLASSININHFLLPTQR